jgi:hypothetical protein
MCNNINCKTRPTFNYENEKKAIYCSIHKLEGMIDVISKTCLYEGCKKQPTFNYENEKIAIYCVKHKLEDMIDIKNKKCLHEGCKTLPNFNYENEKTAIYCVKHKLEDMIDIKNKKCLYEGCKTLPTFNYENEKKPIYCTKHKLEGMINVKDKTCLYEGCKTRASFNYENEKTAIYCVKHKLEDMINVISKTCLYKDCKILPTFNYENEKTAIYCVKHKLEHMIDIKHKMCKTPLCYTLVEDKYEGYCLFCYIHIFPEKPVSRNYKTKEFEVVQFIKNRFNDLLWISDKKIKDGCSNRRPDLLLDLGYQVIIIEIDENQHIDYDCSCENKRIMEISQDTGHRPIIFIRFNPDDYKDNGKNITSCWGNNKKGICVVKKSKQNEWKERLNILEETINYWLMPENIIDKTIEIIELFYDR